MEAVIEDEVRAIFFHVIIAEVLLMILEGKRLMMSELADKLSISKSTFYNNKIAEKLEELGIIKIDEIREGRKTTKMIELTAKGEAIARKLSYVFDDNKEVVPISKDQYTLLKKIAEKTGEGAVSEMVHTLIREKIKKHKAI